MRSLNKQTNGPSLLEKSRLNEMGNELNTLNNSVVTLKQSLEDVKSNVTNLKETVKTNKVDALDIEASNIYAPSISGQTINSYLVSSPLGTIETLKANSLEAPNANIGKGIISEEDVSVSKIKYATITNALITNADIRNIEFGDILASKITATDAGIDNVTSGVITADTLEATEALNTPNAIIGNGTTYTSTVGQETVDVSKINMGEFKTMTNMSKAFYPYYITVPTPSTETGYNIISVGAPLTGTYRIAFYSGTNPQERGDFLFSLTINNTYDNIYFSYSRSSNMKAFEEVYIDNDVLYIKTYFNGILYYTSDALEDIKIPKTYSEYPIDTSKAGYHYVANRSRATVYTKYISNVTSDDKAVGEAVLRMVSTNTYKDVVPEDDPTLYDNVEYDPDNDTEVYIYRPDQELNKGSAVEFKEAIASYINADQLKVNEGMNGQYLRVTDTDDGTHNAGILHYESPTELVDIGNGFKALDPTTNRLVEVSTLSTWDGTVKNGEGVDPVTGEPIPLHINTITHLGDVTEGNWNAGSITTPSLNATDAEVLGNLKVDNTLTTKTLDVTENAHIAGDLTVDGKTITIHTEDITTDSDVITLRHESTTGIQPGESSGVVIENFDGNNTSLAIGVGSDGTMRIGTDIGVSGGDNEPIATRDEASGLINNHLLIWDDGSESGKINRIVDSGVTVSDLTVLNKLFSKPSDVGLDDTGTYTTKAFIDAIYSTLENNRCGIGIIIPAFISNPPLNNSPIILLVSKVNNTLYQSAYAFTGESQQFRYDYTNDAWYRENELIENTDVNITTSLTVDNVKIDDSSITHTTSGTKVDIPYLQASSELVIPITKPTTLVNGSIWIGE